MKKPAEVVVERLGELIGPQAALSTLNTFCKRTVGVNPDAMSASQMVLVLPSLKQLLSVLVGAVKAEAVVAALQQELQS